MENETIENLQGVIDYAIEYGYDDKEERKVEIYNRNLNQKSPGAKKFYGSVADSLEECAKEGYFALFMPELLFGRLKDNTNLLVEGTDFPMAVQQPELWHDKYVTPSAVITGKTKLGSKIVIYAHVPNYLSNPVNVRAAVENKKLINGAAPVPQSEFDRLEALNENGRVFVVDYETLKNSPSESHVPDNIYLSIEYNYPTPLDHPQVIPFLGGNKVNKGLHAEWYLKKFPKIYSDSIGVYHADDLRDEPMGRLLRLGNSLQDDLDGNFNLDRRGTILGVAPIHKE